MRVLAACGWLFPIACGSTSSVQRAEPDVVVTTALAEAVRNIRAGRLNEAEAALAFERAVAAAEPRLLEQLDYYIAAVQAYRGNRRGAERLLQAHAQAALLREDGESLVWMTSSLGWLAWARGDLVGADAACARGLLVTSTLDSEARRAWNAHLHWQRAFFSVEMARSAAGEDRTEKLAAARAACADLADLEPADRSALTAYAWLATGDTVAAAAEAATVNLDEELDPASAYVIACVFDAVGDTTRAAAARTYATRAVSVLSPLFGQCAREPHSGPASRRHQ